MVVQGNDRYTDSQLIAALAVPLGRPVDREQVDRGIDLLWRTFRVQADVYYRPVEGDDEGRIDLLLQVREPALDLEPRFIGNVEVDSEELLQWAGLARDEELFVYRAPHIRERVLQSAISSRATSSRR